MALFKVSNWNTIVIGQTLLSLIEDSKSASELAKTITVRVAVSWMTSSCNPVKIQSILNCFKACRLSNESIGTVLHLADMDTVDKGVSKVAGIEYRSQCL